MAREPDVVAQVLRLALQLVGLDDEPLHRPGRRHQAGEEDHQVAADGGEQDAASRQEARHQHGGGQRQGGAEDDAEGRSDHGDVRVAGAVDHAVGRLQEGEALQVVAPGAGRQEQGDVGRHVPDHGARRLDAAAPADAQRAGVDVGQNDHDRGDQAGHGEAVLLQLQERQLEQIEADVVAEDGVGGAVGARPLEAQKGVPLAVEDEGEDQGDGGGDGDEHQRRRRGGGVLAPAQEDVRRIRGQGLAGDQHVPEGGEVEAPRQHVEVDPEVGQHRHEGDQEEPDLERADGPEDALVAERLQPQVLHQPVGEDGQADENSGADEDYFCQDRHCWPRALPGGRTVNRLAQLGARARRRFAGLGAIASGHAACASSPRAGRHLGSPIAFRVFG